MNSRAKALDGALRSTAQRCYEAAKELPGADALIIATKLAALNEEIYALAEMQASFVAHSDVDLLPLQAGLRTGGTD